MLRTEGEGKRKKNGSNFLFLTYYLSEFILLIKCKQKMSASETKNKCKRCDHAFRFNETKRPLQRSKELCEFVFLSGLINVNKLIDIT